MTEQRILFITRNSFFWGDNRALLNILDGAKSRGIFPMVVMGSHGDFGKALEKRQISYHIVKSYFSIYPPLRSNKDIILFLPRLIRTLLVNYEARRKIIDIAKDFGPVLIHSNVGPVHIGFQVAQKLKIPHVWHLREYQDLNLKMTPLYSKSGFIKKINSPLNHTIAISKGISQHYSLNQNSRIIHDGVLGKNVQKFNPQKEDYFLFAGRLSEWKGVHDLIDAFIEFSGFNENMKLLIAGSGSQRYEDMLKQRVGHTKLDNRVVFLGFRTDVFDLMEKAAALIVPSYFEGFGFITAEAMFHGCLVIGNNTGGTKEILEKERLGILYSGHEELVEAMRTVVTNGIEYYFPLIKRAQRKAVELYSTERNAEEVIQFYQEILKIEF